MRIVALRYRAGMDADSVDHGSGVQPWRQVLAILTRQIEDGTRTGALPGERHLAAELGVSPLSVRKALEALRNAGLVETTRGYGSRVLRPEERPER
jgi:GntR family transcriptional regulator